MRIMLLIFLSLFVNNGFAQETEDIASEMNLAKQYLTGRGVIQDKPRAFKMYLECAKKGSVISQNLVGWFYAKGIGTAKNTPQAIKWLTVAGKAGFSESWYRLGMLYKDETNSKPKYDIAYQYFDKAAKEGNEWGTYAKGYMLYKGLGCTQDYNEAFNLFKTVAANGKNSQAMFFIGTCYRNGYGTTKNDIDANYWLSKAKTLGNFKAKLELDQEVGEAINSNTSKIATNIKNESIQSFCKNNNCKKVNSSMPKNILAGVYEGSLIKYDWSGKYVLQLSKLQVKIKWIGGKIDGDWTIDDTIHFSAQAYLTPLEIVFVSGKYIKEDHYSNGIKIENFLDKARLQWNETNNEIKLIGNLDMFSPLRNEPERPTFITLSKKKSTDNENVNIDLATSPKAGFNATIFPNPATNKALLSFKIEKDANIIVQIFSTNGSMVYQNDLGKVTKGYYRQPLNIENLAAGTYTLSLNNGLQKITKTFIKQ